MVPSGDFCFPAIRPFSSILPIMMVPHAGYLAHYAAEILPIIDIHKLHCVKSVSL